MKKLIALLLSVTMAFAMAGCASKTEETTVATTEAATTEATTEEATTAETTSEEPLKVALCLTGAANDMGWNQMAYEGLIYLEENYGAEVKYTENLGAADMVAAFSDYAAEGFDLVIGHSFMFGDVALEVCDLYPETKFVVIEGDASNGSNVASYVLQLEQSSFLMGMIAGSMTESNKIGIIAPMEGESLIKCVNAYEDGVYYANPDAEVTTVWTGSYVDTALAKEAATAMIENGADVIGHCANECGNGAIQAAQEAGIYATGSSYDQAFMAPETIMVSDTCNVTSLMVAMVESINAGEFVGEIVELGMAEDVVALAPYHDFESIIPQEVQDLIADTSAAIMDGSFVVTKDIVLR